MTNVNGFVTEKKGMLYTVLVISDADGRRQRKWEKTGLKVKGNKTKAKELLQERITEYKNEQSKMTAIQMLSNNEICEDVPFYLYVQIWLESIRNRVELITIEGYTSYAENHIIPYFKEKGTTVRQMNRKTIQAFVNSLADNGNKKTGKALSYSSIKRIKTVIKQTLDKAVKDELITVNPCNLIEMPKNDHRDPTFLNVDEANQMLKAIENEMIYPLIKLDILTGLRRSEIIGLKWENIDFHRRQIHIRHTVTKLSTVVAKDKTKTQSSRRTISMSDEIKSLLLGIKEAQEENRALFGNSYIESDYVFTWPDGHLIDIDYVTRKFGQLLKKHNLKKVRFHDLRHSCASILLSAGYELKDVQEQLGHSEISITADIYGHLDEGRKRALADAMAGLIN